MESQLGDHRDHHTTGAVGKGVQRSSFTNHSRARRPGSNRYGSGSTTATQLFIIGVASPYAWDVVESGVRNDLDPLCVDNHGGADERLPGLTGLGGVDRTAAFTLGLSSATHRAAAARACFVGGFRHSIALLDPRSVVNSTTTIGHGVYVNAGAVVASNTAIGCHANINRSASVGHDDIGFAASIAPGRCSRVGYGSDQSRLSAPGQWCCRVSS